ncbi:MAG: hypothetical protein ACOY7J_08660, partial [Pseudomonadota bacterium]
WKASSMRASCSAVGSMWYVSFAIGILLAGVFINRQVRGKHSLVGATYFQQVEAAFVEQGFFAVGLCMGRGLSSSAEEKRSWFDGMPKRTRPS